MGALTGDLDYQTRLRRAFCRRTLAPQTEIKVWEYAVGKPVDRVQLSADVTMRQQLEEECALFSRLTVEQLQEIADDNARLLGKARRMVQGQLGHSAQGRGPDATDRAGTGEAAATPPGTDIDDG